MRNRPSLKYLYIYLLSTWIKLLSATNSDCPWPRSSPETSSLNSACLCSLSPINEHSIQCSDVNFPLLMGALHGRAKNLKFDLVYINNSDVRVLRDRTFFGLNIKSIQLSYCGIFNISSNAFEGLENSLDNLNLQNNRLKSVATSAISTLHKLKLLDMSSNKIETIPNKAFLGSKIHTLKLAENALSLQDNSFNGLESTLKNLNLKSCSLKNIPTAIKKLNLLAFLDLAQNQIREIEPGALQTLHSLTALNLERNFLQELHPETFVGVSDTLSSLSLLNNLLTTFPVQAINSLPNLRVLDIGFNLITSIPVNAFEDVQLLTLLAVDGNPLSSLAYEVFQHLNGTLRGLSLGGHYFNCDCKISWILDWIKILDLQVTSRDRDPRYCGYPNRLKEKTFYQLRPEDLPCPTETENLTKIAHTLLEDKNKQASANTNSYGSRGGDRPSESQRVRPGGRRPPLENTLERRPNRPNITRQRTKIPPNIETTKNPNSHSPIRQLTSDTAADDNVRSYNNSTKTSLAPRLNTAAVSTYRPTLNRTTLNKLRNPTPISTSDGDFGKRNRPQGHELGQNYQNGPKIDKNSAPKEEQEEVTKFDNKTNKKPVKYDQIIIPERQPELEKPPPRRYPDSYSSPSGRHPIVQHGSQPGDRAKAHVEDISHLDRTTKRYFQEKGEVINPLLPNRSPQTPRRPPKRPRDRVNKLYRTDSIYRGKEVIIQDAYWELNAINIQWDSEVSNILGFRVVYRLFGDKYFKMGQPLSPTAREFKIKNVPSNEYFVACVVSLEEVDVTLERVPFGQCREIRTGDADGNHNNMDKIIIAASGSICGTVIIAVMLFICCYKGKNRQNYDEKQVIPTMMNPASPPLTSLGNVHATKSDWDTVSMYSQRSIPRARMYHQDKDDSRSHVSQISGKSRPRSVADGQSQRSFSELSAVHHPTALGSVHPSTQFLTPLTLSRNDIRLSRQSLAPSQYGSGYHPFTSQGMLSRATSQRTERRRSTRPKSRERSGSRLSYAGSITGYDTDGWTDHDMDIYMARNATRGGGLVQL